MCEKNITHLSFKREKDHGVFVKIIFPITTKKTQECKKTKYVLNFL